MYACIYTLVYRIFCLQLEKYLILLAFLNAVCLFFQIHTKILVQVGKKNSLYLTEAHGLELWLLVVTVKVTSFIGHVRSRKLS